MTTITRKLGWDMGHRVPNHQSLCRNVHGHRYEIEITLRGNVIDFRGDEAEGMVIDFANVKVISKDFINTFLDHGYMAHETLDTEMIELLKKNEFKVIVVPFVPTAENIAQWIFEQLKPMFEDVYETNLVLDNIKLFETPNNFVIYAPTL